MPHKLAFIVSWDEEKAEKLKTFFEKTGWRAETESTDGGRAFKKLKELLPSVVVIDMGIAPSHGREVALNLTDSRITQSLPLLLINVSEDYRQQLCYRIPYAKFFSENQMKDYIESQS